MAACDCEHNDIDCKKILIKDKDEVGNACVSYKTVCKKCFMWYSAHDAMFDNDCDAMEWVRNGERNVGTGTR